MIKTLLWMRFVHHLLQYRKQLTEAIYLHKIYSFFPPWIRISKFYLKVDSVVFLFLDKLSFIFLPISIIIDHHSFIDKKTCIGVLIVMLCITDWDAQCSASCAKRLGTVVPMLKIVHSLFNILCNFAKEINIWWAHIN
jgi:hypothetical protein